MATTTEYQARGEQGAEILKEYDRLLNSRGVWESHWDEIARRIYPTFSGMFNARGMLTPGAKRTDELVDSTGAVALNRFAAIMDSLLTPRNQTWHQIKTSDPELNKIRSVRLYFDEVNRRLFHYRYAPTANFASQNQADWKSLGAFGTGCLFIDELKGTIRTERGLRYRACHLGELVFGENHQGIVDRSYRSLMLTARQADQKFGSENLPDELKGKMSSDPDKQYEFVHCVKPRENPDPGVLSYKGMAYASYYVSRIGQHIVEEGGYTSFPYAISRYEQNPGEIYGRSPAMDILPALKTLNAQKLTVLKQGHRATDPVLLLADDGVMDTFSLKPGATNWGAVSADGRPLVHTLPVGNIAVGKELMDDERELIKDTFLVSLFQILIDSPQKTATEVVELAREKGILLAPSVGRQQSEKLGSVIDREIDVLAKLNLLPEMPPELVEAYGGGPISYKTEYDAPISRLQRAEEASGFMRTMEATLNIVNITQDPSALDFFNLDVIVPELSEINGVPTRWTKSIESVMKIREQRKQSADVDTAITAAPGVAALIKADAAAKTAGTR